MQLARRVEGPLALVELWLANLAPTSRIAYASALSDFAGVAARGDLERALGLLLEGSAAAHIAAQGFRASMLFRELSPSTVNLRLSALRSVLRFARRSGLVDWTLDVAGVASRSYRDTRGPGRATVVSMIGGARSRDSAMIWLMYALGLRRGEVVGLDLVDVDLGVPAIRVVGKGKREAVSLELPPPAAAALRRWITDRGDASGPLFLEATRGRARGRLSGRSVARVVGRLGAALGARVRPHGIRHSAITEALQLTNGNVRAVQQFSRHEDVRTLQLYDDAREGLAREVAALVAAAAAVA